MLAEEREKGRARRLPGAVRDSGPRARLHRQGSEIIVGLQTDAPLKRAIMPLGGWRVVEVSLKSYGFEPDPKVAEIFTKYRKTHNDGVFDAYTPDIKKCRSSHIITGLPDNYGRGRIIGDYRRVALYGVDFLIKERERDKAELDDRHSTEEVIRLREELAEQIRSLKELKQMGEELRLRHRQPAANAHEATQWLYFGYLAGIKQQNGAAMSVGRIVDVPRHVLRARPARGHAHRERRPRRSSTTSSSSSASCGSCARPNTTSCSPATRCGRPTSSAAWATMAGRW